MRKLGLSASVVGIASVIVVGPAGRAVAADGDDVESILKRGTELRRQGRDADALAEFQRAARIEPSARAIGQIALAEQALGLWVEAHEHLDNALKFRGDAWIQKNLPTLNKALGTIESHLGRMEVWGEPAGAEITVEGKVVGKLPAVTAWVPTGQVELRGTARGFSELVRTLQVPTGGRLREHVALRPLGGPKQTTESPPEGRVGDEAPAEPTLRPASKERVESRDLARTRDDSRKEAPLSTSRALADEEGRPSTARRAAKWIAWTLGAGALAVGGYGLARNRSSVGDFNRDCANDPAGGAAYSTSTRSDTQCASLRDDYRSASRLALGGAIGATVLGAVGVVLLLTESAPSPSTRTARWSCLPDLVPDHQGAVRCSFLF